MKTHPKKDKRYRVIVGAVIRDRREKLGLGVPDLVARLRHHKLKIAKSTIYQYEQGRRPIRSDDFPAFAAALDTTIHRLLPEAPP